MICSYCKVDRTVRCNYADCPFETEQLFERLRVLENELEEALKILKEFTKAELAYYNAKDEHSEARTSHRLRKSGTAARSFLRRATKGEK